MAPANIDLLMGCFLFEMKNVKNVSSVSNQIKRARMKWYKLGFKDSANYVFTTERAEIEFDAITKEIKKRLRPEERAIVLSASRKAVFLALKNGTVS